VASLRDYQSILRAGPLTPHRRNFGLPCGRQLRRPLAIEVDAGLGRLSLSFRQISGGAALAVRAKSRHEPTRPTFETMASAARYLVCSTIACPNTARTRGSTICATLKRMNSDASGRNRPAPSQMRLDSYMDPAAVRGQPWQRSQAMPPPETSSWQCYRLRWMTSSLSGAVAR
jgi:hypothetical protein